MKERFTPELIDEDIEAALSDRTAESTARLIHALAALYAPPAEADVALERVRVRVRSGLDSLSVTAPATFGADAGSRQSGETAPAVTPFGEQASTTRRQSVQAGMRMRPAFGALVAVLVLAVVTSGFIYVFQSWGRAPRVAGQPTATTARLLNTPTPLPGQAPSALPVPGTPLVWKTYPIPVPFAQQQTEWGFAVAASSGSTAYICNPVVTSSSHGAQVPEIWATTDRGTQWKHTGDLSALGGVAECLLEVDALDSSRLVATVSGKSVATAATFVDWFSSSDGGRSWQMVAKWTDIVTNSVQIQNTATYQGKTYAIYTKATPLPPSTPTPTPVPSRPNFPAADVQSHLSVSTDGMRTWQPLDAPILALTGSKQSVQEFWAWVDAGGHLELLAEIGAPLPSGPFVWPPAPAPSPVDTLWLSRDAGTHWTQLPAPPMAGFTARASANDQSWLICGSSRAVATAAGQQAINSCSSDSGETWMTRPLLRTCDSSCSYAAPLGDGMLNNCWSACLAADGSLVQMEWYPTKAAYALYRLPANSSQWQYLGLMPGSRIENGFIYAPTATGGLLWSYGGGGGTGTGNSIGVFYTATYPG